MQYPKIPLAQSIITIFKEKGVQHIIISPGSRNAPLTIGFASDPYFKCYSIADERSAGFFALGIAQQIQAPVAVVCTSGSALLNYYPALAEAFYSQIPFIVVSADRPLSKIDIGDGQTIRQQNVFENHSLYNANLIEGSSEENDSKICNAINIALNKKGPTHINAPFEEPLYDLVDTLEVSPKIHDEIPNTLKLSLSKEDIAIWENSPKKLILVGVQSPNVINSEIIEILANDPSVVVMTETTSNISNPNFVSKIDSLITSFTENDFKLLQPDLVITLGGMVVSKRIKAFLRNYKPKNHWHVDNLRAYDTFGCLTKHFEVTPNMFFNEIISKSTTTISNYNTWVQTIKNLKEEKQSTFEKEIPFSDFFVFKQICKHLPKSIQLQISNSSAIRYLQLFKIDSSVEVFCNRGTSGIDGSTSTAIGASIISKKPVVFIGGDIGFFYDSNALWNNYIPENFKIILINNSGGGIFRILPGHQKNELFSTYFETSHQLNAMHLAKMFGFNYRSAKNESETETEILELFKENQKTILEIFTPTQVNDQVLKEYFNALK